MKTLRNLLTAVAILFGTLTMNAQSMSIAAMRSNARFLTDRMAYTLGIRDPFLIDEIYRINYDYIYGVNSYLDDIALGYYYDDYMLVCDARDLALRNLLGITVWNRLLGYSYFHRPIIFSNHRWHFGIYDHDRFGATYFHYAAPRSFGNGYAGGHFFGGMAPRGGRGNVAAPAQGRGMANRPNNAGHIAAPRGDVRNGRGTATPSAPKGDLNNGRGDIRQQGGRSQSNIQSSSRAGSAPALSGSSPARSGAGMSPTRSGVGRGSAGVTRSAGSSRGNVGGSRSMGGGSRGGGRR